MAQKISKKKVDESLAAHILLRDQFELDLFQRNKKKLEEKFIGKPLMNIKQKTNSVEIESKRYCYCIKVLSNYRGLFYTFGFDPWSGNYIAKEEIDFNVCPDTQISKEEFFNVYKQFVQEFEFLNENIIQISDGKTTI